MISIHYDFFHPDEGRIQSARKLESSYLRMTKYLFYLI